jgi:hypothetical protein
MANLLSKYGSIQPHLQFNDYLIHTYCPCLYYPQSDKFCPSPIHNTHAHTPSSSS